MSDKNLRMALASFTGEYQLKSVFYIIDNVETMSIDDLKRQVHDKFYAHILKEYDERNDGPIIFCRSMYLRPEQEGKTWIRFKQTIYPYTFKSMSKQLDYTKDGEIVEIYEED